MKHKHTGTIVFAAILILIGFLALLDSLEIVNFWSALGKLWPVALIALGVWLLVRRRNVVWDEKIEIREGKKYSKAFGDMKIDAQNIDPHGIDAEMGFGDLELNLTKASFSDRENVVHLALGFGDMRIWIPSDIKASITASSGAGDIDLLGKKADGFGKSLEHVDEGFDASRKRLKIHAKVGFGDLIVSRV